jgi:hypothetical protein
MTVNQDLPYIQVVSESCQTVADTNVASRTRVDKLLLGCIPSFFCSNFFFHLGDLIRQQRSAVGGQHDCAVRSHSL